MIIIDKNTITRSEDKKIYAIIEYILNNMYIKISKNIISVCSSACKYVRIILSP